LSVTVQLTAWKDNSTMTHYALSGTLYNAYLLFALRILVSDKSKPSVEVAQTTLAT